MWHWSNDAENSALQEYISFQYIQIENQYFKF